MNSLQIAAALRILAIAFEAPEEGHLSPLDTPAAPAEPTKRGRGRPAKGEETAAPAASAPVQASSTTSPTPAVVEVDPFADAAPVVPSATIDEVRKALTALREASSQDIALAVLKTAGGADNLTALIADKYGVVVQAAKVKALEYDKAPDVKVDTDPFGELVTPAATPVRALTIEDVKAAVVETQKTTAQDTVQKVVMKHGGKAALASGGEGPSLKALPEGSYAAVIAELKALPKTK